MTFDEIGIEEVYNHESLEDVAEMRPSGNDCYVGPDLRNNEDRSLVGLSDWQSEFPVNSAPSTPSMTVEELLSLFF
jgi:hypothetical protein